ncbi:4'-phosphopantetheinyl transferase superfamily protein [Ideonella sp. 4Y11]|uniref:4'-phosphopantetheinyl transferase superfamily protein n=1 Tax=Ideonella aquatica TaxID=2824119 RepID=A0A941BIM2_9BURK|nr:4'-phosphopantetheinyl transferase superfamily protein [Ideonella aquatica]MBQ0957973.1 4'-phosphopantetheinyl transferase superfamily protein [Ideonella aquatica]
MELFDAQERRQLAALTQPRAQLLHLAGRLLVKHLAAERSGWRAADLAVRPDPMGRPRLPALPDLHVSISHAVDRVACVLAPTAALGIDLECPHRRLPSPAARLRYLDDCERRWLLGHPVPAQARAFLRLWTHKEAVMKADGRGLALGLTRVRLQPQEGGALRVREMSGADARPWRITGGQCGGYPWAMAWDSSGLTLDGVSLRRRMWPAWLRG